MPSVIDTPELVEHVDTHDLTIELPQSRRSHLGFWRMLVHGITTYLTSTPRPPYGSACRANRLFEAPMDQFVREYPSLSVYALAII